MAMNAEISTKPMMENSNVVGGQLALFSKDIPNGFFRDGFCRTGPEDEGKHSVAATMTASFLDFTSSKGNNLKAAGVEPGQKWCLYADRWSEVMTAAQEGQLHKEAVAKVNLTATHQAALRTVSYKDLKQSAAEGFAHGNWRQESHHNPENNGRMTKEHDKISSHDLSMAPGKGTEVKGTRGERG
ncbi:hypothetical protein EJ05DRAFT_523216 [Pseudovirgaria hyperparasitica]|uniref:Uncharacterized protein n=1 Tax=Pseudovirgaria hyperparasitica TaxID=470096 RepID=A0A6A6VR78_9PEZI|nr:uncharacterized protein EJ05DRAFT_523216 [Pseudovirgaria hyperparasitica]KAF2753102.1 hypothetical protein EJ05DRAFT_523216 [Pseudovirgaria hyperparasitica]